MFVPIILFVCSDSSVCFENFARLLQQILGSGCCEGEANFTIMFLYSETLF